MRAIRARPHRTGTRIRSRHGGASRVARPARAVRTRSAGTWPRRTRARAADGAALHVGLRTGAARGFLRQLPHQLQLFGRNAGPVLRMLLDRRGATDRPVASTAGDAWSRRSCRTGTAGPRRPTGARGLPSARRLPRSRATPCPRGRSAALIRAGPAPPVRRHHCLSWIMWIRFLRSMGWISRASIGRSRSRAFRPLCPSRGPELPSSPGRNP